MSQALYSQEMSRAQLRLTDLTSVYWIPLCEPPTGASEEKRHSINSMWLSEMSVLKVRRLDP